MTATVCPVYPAALDQAPAEEIVAWAAHTFGQRLTLTASFQDCVLIDVATRVAPGLDVVFLDTQQHFSETLDYVEQLRARYGLALRVIRPVVDMDERWRSDPDGCCRVRKVEPLARALRGQAAWMTGLRRADSPSRSATAVVGWDGRHDLTKIAPLARWSDAEVEAYTLAHDLPRHPLAAQGYRSIGCAPCTAPTPAGGDARAGRWAGLTKTECGLHR